MIEELKTLKDLKHIEFEFINDNDLVGMEVISIDKLRAEAVKWVKELRSLCEDCEYLNKINNHHPYCWRCNFWMERFNLTDEDLKDE